MTTADHTKGNIKQPNWDDLFYTLIYENNLSHHTATLLRQAHESFNPTEYGYRFKEYVSTSFGEKIKALGETAKSQLLDQAYLIEQVELARAQCNAYYKEINFTPFS